MPIMADNRTIGPKQRQKHHSYDESVDEPAKLIDDEAVEVEREAPAEANESAETIERENTSEPPAFEEA